MSNSTKGLWVRCGACGGGRTPSGPKPQWPPCRACDGQGRVPLKRPSWKPILDALQSAPPQEPRIGPLPD